MEHSITLIGTLIAIAGAALAVISKVSQDYLIDIREQNKLKSIVRGELVNIKRHYKNVKREVQEIEAGDNFAFGPDDRRRREKHKISWVKRKHGDISFLKTNIAKLGFIDEYTMSEFLQASLFIRNNDLEIDYIISILDEAEPDMRELRDVVRRILKRTEMAINISDYILERPAVVLSQRSLKVVLNRLHSSRLAQKLVQWRHHKF